MRTGIIALIALASLIIAFISVFLLYGLHQYLTSNYVDEFVDPKGKIVLEKNFFNGGENRNEDQIFIIGSSHVQSLNTTYIHNYLMKYNLNYHVYNFGQGSDQPIDRLKTIDMIISKKPKIVVYGISYRDFGSSSSLEQQDEKMKNYLPSPNSAFKKISATLPIPSTTFDFLRNPEEITIAAVAYILSPSSNGKSQTLFFPYPNAPYQIDKNDTIILTNDELAHYYDKNVNPFNGIDSVDNNDNVGALKEIINKLLDHDIKIVVFTTPQSQYFLNTLSHSDKEKFNMIIENLSNQSGIEIYSLNDKYADLSIWKDPTHVAINDNVTVYNQDISRFILKELVS